MMVIDKTKLDKLIALTKEYFDDGCSGARLNEILEKREKLLNEWQDELKTGQKITWIVGEFVASAVLLKKCIRSKKIYKMLACIGYEVKEVKEND